MSNSIENTLVLCDLDNLLLNAEGNLPQLHRDVLQLSPSGRRRSCVLCWAECGSVHLRWFAAAFWPIILRRAAAQRCAALPGWKIPS